MAENEPVEDDDALDDIDYVDLADYGTDHPEGPEYLFAQTAGRAEVADGRIVLKDVAANTLFFSDRPYRFTGHVPTDEFVDGWDEGDDNFASDPPNAVLSLFQEDEVNDVVIVLSDPQLDGRDLSYAVEVTDGELSDSNGPASLFIDRLGRPMTPMSVAGVHRRRRRRGRRRVRRRMR